uniref:Si:ch211-212k18.7 n=1 Tax=Sinocyclocheilus anshuiensis TaxID=1608454 RepID=A0A671LJ66_9TELE
TTHSPNTTTTTHSPNTTTTTHSPNTTTTTHSPNTTTTTHSPNTTTTTHSPNTTTTTHSPNTTTTTHSPNTTTTTHSPNTTTTTHSPNTTTTTHSPNTTTTHSPNTTTHNPNSTTTAPSTTTTSIPVPTPSTNMTTGNYNFSDDKGILCIMVVAAIGIHVNTSEVNGTFIVQPSKTNVSGDCSEEVASLMITFNEGDISLQFQKVSLFTDFHNEFFKMNYTGTNRSLELFSVDLGYSYSCKAETVYMGGGVSLDLTQYRVQAFDIKNKNFGPPELCKADQPDYRVPIAVGIILIILIIIVVIAYLISRKRRTDGYQSL